MRLAYFQYLFISYFLVCPGPLNQRNFAHKSPCSIDLHYKVWGLIIYNRYFGLWILWNPCIIPFCLKSQLLIIQIPSNISMGKVLVYISKVKVVINRRATYREVSKVLSNTLKQQQWSLNVRQNLPTKINFT